MTIYEEGQSIERIYGRINVLRERERERKLQFDKSRGDLEKEGGEKFKEQKTTEDGWHLNDIAEAVCQNRKAWRGTVNV